MPTFTYSPTDCVTLAPSGDVSLTDGVTTTTFSRTGAMKTLVKNPPDPAPSTPEVPVSQKTKPSGDVIHTYSDITKTPPVTTRITFRASGDVEILVTIGQDRKLVDIHGITGVRRTKTWKDPDPEPENWGKSETARGGAGSTSGNGSKGGKKPKRSVRRTARRSRPARKRSAPRHPKKKAKRKARRR